MSTGIPRVRDPMIVPYDPNLLGRLVVDPDNPFNDFINLVDGGMELTPEYTKPSATGPIIRTTFQREFYSRGYDTRTERLTVTSIGWELYELPHEWHTRDREYRDSAYQKAALRFGHTFYLVSSFRTVEGYQMTPVRDPEDPLLRRTRVPAAAFRLADRANPIVMFIRFDKVTMRTMRGNLYPFRSISGAETSFLDWSRGPGELSAIEMNEESLEIEKYRHGGTKEEQEIVHTVGVDPFFVAPQRVIAPASARPSNPSTIPLNAGSEVQSEKGTGDQTVVSVGRASQSVKERHETQRLESASTNDLLKLVYGPDDVAKLGTAAQSAVDLLRMLYGSHDVAELGTAAQSAVPLPRSSTHNIDQTYDHMGRNSRAPTHVFAKLKSARAFGTRKTSRWVEMFEDGTKQASGPQGASVAQVDATSRGAGLIGAVSGERAYQSRFLGKLPQIIQGRPPMRESPHDVLMSMNKFGGSAALDRLIPHTKQRPPIAQFPYFVIPIDYLGGPQPNLVRPPTFEFSSSSAEPMELPFSSEDGQTESKMIDWDYTESWPSSDYIVGKSNQEETETTSVTSTPVSQKSTLETPAIALSSELSSPLSSFEGLDSTPHVGRSITPELQQISQALVQASVMDHSWPIRFSRGKRNIVFPFQSRLTAANTAKAWIEHIVREPINWWPLSPRRHPLPEDFVWVEWQCGCGRIISTTIPTERRMQYHQWIAAATAGTSSAPAKPIPMTATTTAVLPPNSPSALPTLPPPGASGIALNSPNMPQTLGGAKTIQHKLLMWCVNLSTKLTVVINLVVPSTDENIFRDLGTQYRKTRGWRGWFSLHTISEIKFVKFVPYRIERIGLADRVRVTCDPTEQLPIPTNLHYQYEPKPPAEIPPVPTRLLMEYFDDPSCAGTSTAILEAFPVRTTGEMTRLEKHGWGLHAQEHLSFWRIMCLTALFLAGPIAFFVYWLVAYPGDLQNASVPLGLAFGFIGTFAVLFDRGK